MYFKHSVLHGFITGPLIVGTLGITVSVYGWLALIPGVLVATAFWWWRLRKWPRPATWPALLAPHVLVLGVSLGAWLALFTIAGFSYAQAPMPSAAFTAPFYGLSFLGALLGIVMVLPELMLANFLAPVLALTILAWRGKRPTWTRHGWWLAAVLVVLSGWFGSAQYLHHGQYLDHLSEPSAIHLSRYRPNAPHNRLATVAKPKVHLTQPLPRLDGATAAYPLYAAAAQATYPKLTAKAMGKLVQVNQTDDAYWRLITGKCDVAVAFRPSAAVLREAKKAGVTLTCTPIAKEGFVFFTSSQNPVRNLTTRQLQAIYQRRLTNWHQVDGHWSRIRPFQRPADSGSQTTMRQLVMAGKPMTQPLASEVVDGMGGIISAVADYENTPSDLGYSYRFYLQGMQQAKGIRLLKIDGVAPTTATIRSGRYPFTPELVAVTARPRSAETRRLIDWLTSPQGQRLVAATGYVGL